MVNTIEDYNLLSLEEKEKFFQELSINGNVYTKAIRQKKTKNMKQQGYKQPNGFLTFVDELKRIDKKITNFYYLCKCDCGNWYILTNTQFDKENMKSCGCYRKQRGAEMLKELGTKIYKDISNQIFCDLKAIEPINRGQNGKLIWKCQCINCGEEQNVLGTLLRNGHRSFCQYCNTERKSQGERKIRELLNNNNINYQTEKTFETCKFIDTNYHARFDFYINNSYLIEFDGEQHFKPTRFDTSISEEKAQENFVKIQKKDKYKNKWCKDNDIPLIRIPYTRLKDLCLEDLLLETTTFLV